MLILVGTVPTAYALNHAMTRKTDSDDFIAVSQQAAGHSDPNTSPRMRSSATSATKSPITFAPAIHSQHHARLAPAGERHRATRPCFVRRVGKSVPQDSVRNFRNDMYIASEALRLMKKNAQGRRSQRDRLRRGWTITSRTSIKRRSFIPGMGQGRGGAWRSESAPWSDGSGSWSRSVKDR